MNATVVWTVGQRPTRRAYVADVLAGLAFHLRYRCTGAHS